MIINTKPCHHCNSETGMIGISFEEMTEVVLESFHVSNPDNRKINAIIAVRKLAEEKGFRFRISKAKGFVEAIMTAKEMAKTGIAAV